MLTLLPSFPVSTKARLAIVLDLSQGFINIAVPVTSGLGAVAVIRSTRASDRSCPAYYPDGASPATVISRNSLSLLIVSAGRTLLTCGCISTPSARYTRPVDMTSSTIVTQKGVLVNEDIIKYPGRAVRRLVSPTQIIASTRQLSRR